MPETPFGFPYPNPTDPVSLGANDIRALAEAIETHEETGGRFVRGPDSGNWRLLGGGLVPVTIDAAARGRISFGMTVGAILTISVTGSYGGSAMSYLHSIDDQFPPDVTGFYIKLWNTGAAAPQPNVTTVVSWMALVAMPWPTADAPEAKPADEPLNWLLPPEPE